MKKVDGEEKMTIEKKKTEARKKANDFLKQLFNTVSEDQIQHILEENEGDVDATTDQLVRLVTKKEEEERKVQQLRKIQQEREMIIEILVNRFSNLKKDQIISTVEKHLWNVKTASIELLKQSEKKKKEQIAQLFRSFTDEEIETALTENNWQVLDSTKKLEELRKQRVLQKAEKEKKTLEKQKQAQKLAEVKSKIEEEQQKNDFRRNQKT